MNETESALAVSMGVELMRTKACQAVMALLTEQKQKGASLETIQSILNLYREINGIKL